MTQGDIYVHGGDSGKHDSTDHYVQLGSSKAGKPTLTVVKSHHHHARRKEDTSDSSSGSDDDSDSDSSHDSHIGKRKCHDPPTIYVINSPPVSQTQTLGLTPRQLYSLKKKEIKLQKRLGKLVLKEERRERKAVMKEEDRERKEIKREVKREEKKERRTKKEEDKRERRRAKEEEQRIKALVNSGLMYA